MALTLEVLKEIIDTHFCPPFMDAGIVQTILWPAKDGNEKSLEVIIGQRDVQFLEDGTVIGAGTSFHGCIGWVEGEAEDCTPDKDGVLDLTGIDISGAHEVGH